MIGGTASSLIRRGYIACSYSGSVDAPGTVAQLYPEHDFASMGQVAFTMQTVVDYLLTVPQVDKARIAITGYSRAGKMALIAAALDDRIAAVIAGSTGVGGVTPWRLSGEYGMGEGVESTTRSFPIWFHPRLRFFSGKEDRLPVDGNLIVAMVAPRAILIEYGLNDEVSNTWSHEQVYLLGAEGIRPAAPARPHWSAPRARVPRVQRRRGLARLARHPVRALEGRVGQQAAVRVEPCPVAQGLW